MSNALPDGSWNLRSLLEQATGLRTFADTLVELVDEGHPVFVATADLKYSNGLASFEERHPEHFFQFGISEQNMVSAVAGMATLGVVPYAATFASFLALLCCEQIRTDIAYPGLPVRLVGHHAGITLGFYGTSHHATEDLAIMRSMSGMTVVAPADSAQFRAALRATVSHPGPIYFRIGRGREPDVYPAAAAPFSLGEAISHQEGADLTIIATGSTVHPSLAAAEALRGDGLSVGVINMHTIKPLDVPSVLRSAEHSSVLMTVEEHSTIGGLGGAVAEVLAAAGSSTALHAHGIHDEFSLIGPPTHLYAHYELDAGGIEKVSREVLQAA